MKNFWSFYWSMIRILLAVTACAFVVAAILHMIEYLLGDGTLAAVIQLIVVIASFPAIAYWVGKLFWREP